MLECFSFQRKCNEVNLTAQINADQNDALDKGNYE